MNILLFLLVGLVAGFLAGKIATGHGFGVFRDTALGMAGAVIGGMILGPLGAQTFGDWGGLVTATIGAIGLLFLANLLRIALTPGKSVS